MTTSILVVSIALTSSLMRAPVPQINPYEQAVNDARHAVGMVGLKSSACLRAAAVIRGREILRTGRYTHYRPNGKRFFYGLRCGQVGIWRGENLARYNTWTAEQVATTSNILSKHTVTAWMNSPAHQKILYSKSARNIGISIVGNMVILEESGK